jgi:hypothetical protein
VVYRDEGEEEGEESPIAQWRVGRLEGEKEVEEDGADHHAAVLHHQRIGDDLLAVHLVHHAPHPRP